MSFALPSSYPDSLKIKIKPYIQEKVKVKGYASMNEIGGLFGVWVTAFTYVMSDGIGVQASHPTPNVPIKIKRGSFGPFFAVRTSQGYQFNSKAYLGASIEMDVQREDGYSSYLLPLCVDFRYTPLNKRITPLINQRLGYTINLVPDDLKYKLAPMSGPTSETQIGLRYYISSKIAFNFSLSYRLQDFICQSSALNDGFGFYLYRGKYANVLNVEDAYQTKPPPAHLLAHFITLMVGLSF